jgi:hypothetical protein
LDDFYKLSMFPYFELTLDLPTSGALEDDLTRLLETGMLSDIEFKIEGETIPAHRCQHLLFELTF